jgi:hypothetical protein
MTDLTVSNDTRDRQNTSLLTLRCRILLDKSTVAQLLTEFRPLSGARRLTDVLRKDNLFHTVATHIEDPLYQASWYKR